MHKTNTIPAVTAAKLRAERDVHLGAFKAIVHGVVEKANAAANGVAPALVEATTALAKLPVFKGLTPADFDRLVKPILKAELAALVTVGAASKSVMLTGARNLALALANGIAPGKVALTQATWNQTTRAKLEAKGVMKAPDSTTPAKGRPKGTTGGTPAGKGAQVASKGKAGDAKALAPLDVIAMLRTAGMGDHSEQLAHMVLNERPALVKWLDSMAD